MSDAAKAPDDQRDLDRTDATDGRAVIIAIDGPSAVGKSTVARLVAELLEVPYLDTGAMYRSLALEALRADLPEEPTEQDIESLLANLDLELSYSAGNVRIALDGEDVGDEIRSQRVSERTSLLAAKKSVRQVMVERQQTFGHQYGGVLEGRDIGTRVFPETPYKFFLDAHDHVRAERRWLQLKESQPDLTVEQVEKDLAARDQRDRERAESPLQRTSEHILVDTASSNAEGVAQRIVDFVRCSNLSLPPLQ